MAYKINHLISSAVHTAYRYPRSTGSAAIATAIGSYFYYQRVYVPQKNLELTQHAIHLLNSPDELTFAELGVVRDTKKKIKKYLHSSHPDPDLKKLYRQMVELYDNMVLQDDALTFLRGISQRMRQIPLSEEDLRIVTRFMSLFSPDGTFNEVNEIKRLHKCVEEGSVNELFNQLRGSFLREVVYAAKNRNLLMEKGAITWLHGTSSTNLPGILEHGGILPMGMLIQAEGSPNGGKLAGNHTDLNREHISGERFSKSFFLEKDGCPNGSRALSDVSSRYLTTLRYACPTSRGGKSLLLTEKTALEQITDYMKKSAQEQLSQEDDIHTYVAVMYLRKMNLASFAPHLNQLQNCLQQSHRPHPLLQRALTQSVKTFSPAEIEFIKHPFPIVFASSSLHPIPSTKLIPDGDDTEYLVEGKIKLGQDLQFAFTPRGHVPDLQRILAPYKITVLPLFQGSFQEIKTILTHSGNISVRK